MHGYVKSKWNQVYKMLLVVILLYTDVWYVVSPVPPVGATQTVQRPLVYPHLRPHLTQAPCALLVPHRLYNGHQVLQSIAPFAPPPRHRMQGRSGGWLHMPTGSWTTPGSSEMSLGVGGVGRRGKCGQCGGVGGERWCGWCGWAWMGAGVRICLERAV